MKNKLVRNFPVALILASSSLFMGNNQNTYAEGIMSATPTTVVVAEFINESDATWWKPKYKSSFKNMLTNALSNTGNFTVLELSLIHI